MKKTWKDYIFLTILFSVIGIIGGYINGYFKDIEIDSIKMQAVKLGVAHVVAIDNKLEWRWIETIWIDPNTEPIYYRDDEGNYITISKESLYFIDDEGNDIKVTE